ncbi:Uncharacterized protein HZ326_31045 [Fusarium oxysporum f. sp. albedinis]|nr:Uncharacterized protein HZ326_31045 [Fusarium oxysporum f. sp. albedinis]
MGRLPGGVGYMAGSVVVKVLNTVIFPYAEDIHTGKLPVFNLSLPLVPHPSHIGRVHSVGSDAILAKPGDLVFFSAAIYARDDPSVNIIQGHHGGEGTRGRKLMNGEWRDGALQEYQRVPLENVFVLDEDRLCRQLGYTPADLHEISFYTIGAGAVLEGAKLLWVPTQPDGLSVLLDRVLTEKGFWGWLVKPWLILKAAYIMQVIGDIDFALPLKDVQKAAEILEKKKDVDSEVVIIPNAKHGFAVRGDPDNKEEKDMADQAEDQLVKWFAKYLS